ncbi:MAG TPA: hypothetical protein VEX11_14165, partial [Acetobacteraceae bacterium]|nr:hypothetical protein [Acetobacteraceae bacterium]
PESAYIRRPSEAQSWLAEGRLPVDADPQLWLDRDVVNLPATRIREVAVRRTDEPELVLARAGQAPEAGPKLALTAPPGFEATDESAVDEVSRALESVTFLDVKPEGDAPGEAVGESRFTLTEGPAVLVAAYRDGDKLWLRLRAEGDGSAAQTEAERLNARWHGWAYQAAAWKEKAVLPRLSDLGGRASVSDATPAPATQDSVPSRAATPSTASQPATAAEAAPAGESVPSPATAEQRPLPAIAATPAAPPAPSSGEAAAPAASPDAAPAIVAEPTAPAAENSATAPSPSPPASNQVAAPASSAAQTAAPAATVPPGAIPSGGGQAAATTPRAPAAAAPTPTASSPPATAAPSPAIQSGAPRPVTTAPNSDPPPIPTPSAGPAGTDGAVTTAPPAAQVPPPATTAQPAKPERTERASNRNRGNASRDHPQQSSAAPPR